MILCRIAHIDWSNSQVAEQDFGALLEPDLK